MLLLAAVAAVPTPYSATITSGTIFSAEDGSPVHAHGAGLVLPDAHPGDGRTYFLVGTTKKHPSAWLSTGVNLYSSTDLQHWAFVRQIFNASQITTRDAKAPPYRLERPKILYNAATRRYVMWFHLDDAAFSMGNVGVAVSGEIGGAYQFLAGWRPDGLRSLDMGLFQEDGGAAYLVRSVDNQYVGFSRLTDDYTNTSAAGIVSRGPRCEGQAVWRERGPPSRLYLLCSHLTGWSANPLLLARSDGAAIENATWTELGNPTHDATSFDSQSTYVLPLSLPQGRLLLYMGDRWNAASESGGGSVGNASYVWLPLLRNASDPTGFTIADISPEGGKRKGDGAWRVAAYLQKDEEREPGAPAASLSRLQLPQAESFLAEGEGAAASVPRLFELLWGLIPGRLARGSGSRGSGVAVAAD